MTFKTKILADEYWYGGATEAGTALPFGADDIFSLDLRINKTPNQAAPVLVSNKGRYIWSDKGFLLEVNDGNISIVPEGAPVIIEEGGLTLRDAYKAVSKKFFPPSNSLPDRLMFEMPQYCTWIELQYEQNQKAILDYAAGILKSGMPAGELIIDDNWQIDYGVWDFDPGAFARPKEMVSKLKEMGFKVILWIAPYISPDCATFRDLEQKGFLVRGADGFTAVRRWWNGYSAVLDFTNPGAAAWFDAQTGRLCEKYGIDGFKLDGGDTYMYREDDITFAPETPNGQCRRWAELGEKYGFNELRACWTLGGSGIAQRLCDKTHSWDAGLGSLIPCAINLGLLGHPFCCPDMIGGGSFTDFADGKIIDEELCIRWLQASAFMPMMQYSFALWNRLSLSGRKTAVYFARQRQEFGSYFYDLAKLASIDGEPMVRSLEYMHPGQGFEKTIDCFRIGQYLVAPVLEKGAKNRKLRLPQGRWQNIIDGKEYIGGKEEDFKVNFNELLFFKLITINL